MVSMDQVVRLECAEIVFYSCFDGLRPCDHVVLQFRGGKSARTLESTSNSFRVWVDGGAAAAAQTVRMDHLLCQECVEIVFI